MKILLQISESCLIKSECVTLILILTNTHGNITENY